MIPQPDSVSSKCPDCHALVPRGEEYTYFCKACEEYLAIDNYSVNHLAPKGVPFKMLADSLYFSSLGPDHVLPILQKKLLESCSNLKQLTARFAPQDDISRIEWFQGILTAQNQLSKLELMRDCSTEPIFVNTLSLGLGSCVSLTDLSLTGFQISKGTGSILGEAIKSLTNLTILQFNKLSVDVPEDLAHLSSALQMSRSIRNFTLSDDITSWNIMDGVLERNKSIESLTLTATQPSTTIDQNSLKRIFNGLADNNTLLNLDIQCSFDRSALEILKNSLQSNRSITNLTLICDIDNDGLGHICSLLNVNKTLQSLTLSSNKYTVLPAALLDSASVTELNLDDGKFEVDVEEFAEALKKNSKLKALSLRTKLSSDGCRSVMAAVKANKTLETLRISLANCNEAALNYCASVLETHPSLVDLSLAELGENDRSYSPFGAVTRVIKNNTNLERLLAYGAFDEEFHSILPALTSNNTLTTVRVCVTDGMCMLMDDEAPFLPIFDVNYALTDLHIYDESQISPFLQRNLKIQRGIKSDVATVLHNIARDESVKSKLPVEMWINIFKWLRYPGLKSFAAMAHKILNKYK